MVFKVQDSFFDKVLNAVFGVVVDKNNTIFKTEKITNK